MFPFFLVVHDWSLLASFLPDSFMNTNVRESQEPGSCLTPSPGLLLAYINSVIINGTCSPDLFVRNDYTIIMINATDIQILESHTTSQPVKLSKNKCSTQSSLNKRVPPKLVDTNTLPNNVRFFYHRFHMTEV